MANHTQVFAGAPFKVYLQNRAAYECDAIENAKVIREKFSIEKHLEVLRKVYEGAS